jgi:hypothetical protein
MRSNVCLNEKNDLYSRLSFPSSGTTLLRRDIRETIHGGGMKQSASIAKASAPLGLLGLALLLVGCSADGTTYGHTTGAPTNGVFVIQNTPASGTTTAASGSVLEFSPTASGAAAPVATIANLNVTSLGFLAVDATGNVYTAATEGSTGTSLVEFPVGSQNNAQPIRSIPFNSTTELTTLSSLSADIAGDLYASNGAGGVSIFTAVTTGSVAPAGTVTITSDAGPQATAVDPSGNLYVATATPVNTIAIAPIVVFSLQSNTSTPTRSIGGALTMLDIATPKGLATDTAGNLYVANVVSGVSSILVFEPTASGNTPPMRDITGSNTLLGCVAGIAVDTEGGFVYVVSTPTCGSTASPTVLKFSTTGDGNIAPISSFTSNAWTNPDPTLSIAVY